MDKFWGVVLFFMKIATSELPLWEKSRNWAQELGWAAGVKTVAAVASVSTKECWTCVWAAVAPASAQNTKLSLSFNILGSWHSNGDSLRGVPALMCLSMSLACQENKSLLSAWAWYSEKWRGGAARFEIANPRPPGHCREEQLNDFLWVSGWHHKSLHFGQDIDQACPRNWAGTLVQR